MTWCLEAAPGYAGRLCSTENGPEPPKCKPCTHPVELYLWPPTSLFVGEALRGKATCPQLRVLQKHLLPRLQYLK